MTAVLTQETCTAVRTADGNALSPVWDSTFTFTVHFSAMALLRFAVYHEDVFGEPVFAAQACAPADSIATGTCATLSVIKLHDAV